MASITGCVGDAAAAASPRLWMEAPRWSKGATCSLALKYDQYIVVRLLVVSWCDDTTETKRRRRRGRMMVCWVIVLFLSFLPSATKLRGSITLLTICLPP